TGTGSTALPAARPRLAATPSRGTRTRTPCVASAGRQGPLGLAAPAVPSTSACARGSGAVAGHQLRAWGSAPDPVDGLRDGGAALRLAVGPVSLARFLSPLLPTGQKLLRVSDTAVPPGGSSSVDIGVAWLNYHGTQQFSEANALLRRERWSSIDDP